MNRQTNILILAPLIVLFLGLVTPSRAEDSKMLTKAQAEKVLQSGKLHGVRGKNDIPKVWWQAMALDQVSDIDGPFSAGCTGPEPHCRLIAAAISDDCSAIITETGGIAYFIHLKLFKKKDSAVKCVYDELIQEARLKQLRKLLETPAPKDAEGKK